MAPTSRGKTFIVVYAQVMLGRIVSIGVSTSEAVQAIQKRRVTPSLVEAKE